MPAPPSPVLVIGARSEIARAIARRYALEGCDVILAARGVDDLRADAADLHIRHAVAATCVECDVTDPDPDAFLASLPVPPRTIVIVAGLLGEHAISASRSAAASAVMAVNFTGPALHLLAGARLLARGGRGGCLIAISSVAGERGRPSNFIYGASKAGLTALLSGLRGSLVAKGVSVITVKPGYVATRMTAGMAPPKCLVARPDQVAAAIVRAQREGRDVVYVKAVWRPIMALIRLLPEAIFKRLPL